MLTKIEDGKLKLTSRQASDVLKYLSTMRDIGRALNEARTQAGDLVTIMIGGESCEIGPGASADVVALLRGEKLRIRKRLRELYGIVIE